jgi:hypothetical protein
MLEYMDEIKTDGTEIGYEFMEQIDLAHDHNKLKAYVKLMLNFWATKDVGNSFASYNQLLKECPTSVKYKLIVNSLLK